MDKIPPAIFARDRAAAITLLEAGETIRVINYTDLSRLRLDFNIARSLVATGIAKWGHNGVTTDYRRLVLA